MGNLPVGGRTRSLAGLFAAVALMNTAMVGTSTAGTLLAAGRGDSWSGLPNAAGVLGTAAGALGVGAVTVSRGPRFALLGGYGIAVTGGLLAASGAAGDSVTVLAVGLVLVGIGNGAAQLSRHLAAELYPSERAGFGLSVIVWAGTVGALAGPALMAPASRIAEALSLPALSGPCLVGAVVIAGSAVVTASTPGPLPVLVRREPLTRASFGAAVRHPGARMPLMAMLGAQGAMVMVMTMTPVRLEEGGGDLAAVSWVLSAHMVGMFALAPVSGWIADRWGGRATVLGGVGILVVAAPAAMATPAHSGTGTVTHLSFALFLLGYGWNLMFVGAGGMLRRELAEAERTLVQAAVDAVVWSVSALASLLAGQVLAVAGYPAVALAGGVAALLPLAFLRHSHRTP